MTETTTSARAEASTSGPAAAPAGGAPGTAGESARALGRRSARRRRAWLAADVVLLAAVTVLLLRRRPGEDSFWYPDASRHAMDGVFIIDILRDGGFGNPYHYGLHYAAKYPAVGAAYYPPFFALVEAGVYCLAGIGMASARATVVLFAVVGAVAAYLHGRAARGRAFGLTVALCFVTMPEVALWSRGVMLEMPAAAMVLLTGLFVHLWANERKRWAGYACALALVASVLTKQSAAFMFAVVPLYLITTRRARLLWSREALIAYALFAALLVPYGVLQWRTYGNVVKYAASGKGAGRLLDPARWTYLFRRMPRAASWPVAVLAAVGLAFAILDLRLAIGGRRARPAAGGRKPQAASQQLGASDRQSAVGSQQSAVSRQRPEIKNQKSRIRNGECPLGHYLVVWFLVAYVFSAYAMSGSLRYLYLVFPIVAFLAAYGVHTLVPLRVGLGAVPVRGLCIAYVLGWQSCLAWNVSVPRVSDGYEKAAELVASCPRGETVLFHGFLSGNFIYHVRVADPERRLIVLRSDKLFGRLHRLGDKKGTFSSDVESATDVRQLLQEHGVGYVVIEPNDSSQVRGVNGFLLEAVSQPPWQRRACVPLTSHRTLPGSGDILVFENPQAGRARAETIPFWVPMSQREFRVTYDQVRRIFGGH